MSAYVIMPKADYIAACNAIRAKTEKTDLIKSGDLESEILGITTGGGSSEDVRYVTFMSEDGTVELGKKAVATGDDCADPIARGVFPTPTKESTAQYNYTFYGWATTPNGAADSNWNKAVTEDRTVYANFASVVRYYTITYYDSNGITVLKTESLAYGSVPSYVPSKTGFAFKSWNPSIASVTGNASYTASWDSVITFANATWKQIAEIVANGKAQETFALGETKNLVLTQTDGSVLNVPVKIAAFSHDTLSDGSGKAGITIICNRAIDSLAVDNTENYYKWSTSAMRTRLNTGAINSMLPNDLRAYIKRVDKATATGRATGGNVPTVETTQDRIWLLSADEVGIASQYVLDENVEKYPIFTNDASKIMYKLSSSTKKAKWPLRSGWTQYTGALAAIETSGAATYGYFNNATGDKIIIFGFCI